MKTTDQLTPERARKLSRENPSMLRNSWHTRLALIAGAMLVFTSPSTLGAKPGGSVSDLCTEAEARGFPSFGFNRSGRTNWEYYFADRDGTCTQRIWSRAMSSRYSDVVIRYDSGSQTGVALGSVGTVFSVVASQFTVQFDADGRPTVAADAFNVVLTLAELAARPLPADPLLAGWQIASMGGARISPSGNFFLLQSRDRNGTVPVYWKCSLGMPVDSSTCSVVYFAPSVDRPYVNWGASDATLHVLRSASAGSGSSLYVVDLASGTSEEVYGRGTWLTTTKATLVERADGTQTERVALHEAGPTVCDQLNVVIDLDTCSGNQCFVVNGAGHIGAAALTWLPDGRVAQNAISRKGSNCSGTGTITAFDPVTDMNGSATTLTTGQDPNGAGGG